MFIHVFHISIWGGLELCLGGLGALLGGAKPPTHPRGDRTNVDATWLKSIYSTNYSVDASLAVIAKYALTRGPQTRGLRATWPTRAFCIARDASWEFANDKHFKLFSLYTDDSKCSAG